jgi:hypothetical protein
VSRSAHGMRGAAARWNKAQSTSNAHDNAPAMPEHSPSNAGVDAPPLVKPIQTNPIQANPNQSKTTSSEAVASDEQVSKSTSRKEPSPAGIELAQLLCQRILGNNPDAKVTESQVREWGRVADHMIRIDKRAVAAIRELIEFSQADRFWLQNILSMGTLREKFDQLTVRRKGSAKPQAQTPQRLSENLKGEEARPLLDKMPPLPCS